MPESSHQRACVARWYLCGNQSSGAPRRRDNLTHWLISTQVAAHPDATLKVALACLDASPEAAAKLIVALAADEDLNRFWPVLSQWEAWVKSNEMGRGWRPTVEMRHFGDTVWRLFNISSDAAKASIGRSKIQFLINCCAWANCCADC